jgi:hypothetical protein
MGEVRESFPPAVSTDIQQIVQFKEAERRRLRALPWLEKLEMLEKLRARHLLIQRTHFRKDRAPQHPN